MKPESGLENMVKRNKTVLTYRHDFMVHHYGVTPGSWWMCGLTWQKMSRLWWAHLSHSLISSQLHRNHLSCDLWLKLAKFLNSLRKKHVFTKELQLLHLKKKAKAILFLANKECLVDFSQIMLLFSPYSWGDTWLCYIVYLSSELNLLW